MCALVLELGPVLHNTRVNLGCDVIIGAGSTVLSDIPDGMLAVGSPCEVVKDLRRQI